MAGHVADFGGATSVVAEVDQGEGWVAVWWHGVVMIGSM